MTNSDHEMPVPHSGMGQPTGDAASDSAQKELIARSNGDQAIKADPKEAMRMFLQNMATSSKASKEVRDSAKLLRRAPSDPTVDRRKQQLFDLAMKDGSLKRSVSPHLMHFFEANLHHQQDLPDDLRHRAEAGTLHKNEEALTANAQSHEVQRVVAPEVVHAPPGGEVKKAAVHKLEEYAGAIIAPTYLG